MNLPLIGLTHFLQLMTLYLFSTAYYEAIKFSREKGKVNGTTFFIQLYFRFGFHTDHLFVSPLLNKSSKSGDLLLLYGNLRFFMYLAFLFIF